MSDDADLPTLLQFWGKARPAEGASSRYHPLPYHSLDVAAVADTILSQRPDICAFFAKALKIPESSVRKLLTFLIALHDIGKISGSFQALAEHCWPVDALGEYSDRQLSGVQNNKHTAPVKKSGDRQNQKRERCEGTVAEGGESETRQVGLGPGGKPSPSRTINSKRSDLRKSSASLTPGSSLQLKGPRAC